MNKKSINTKIMLHANRLRRRISNYIEPNKLDPDPFWDVPITIGLKYSEQLRQNLSIDDNYFTNIDGFKHADPRSYVLYASINEVIKSSLQLMRLQEFFHKNEIKSKSRVDRLIRAYIIEEQETIVGGMVF